MLIILSLSLFLTLDSTLALSHMRHKHVHTGKFHDRKTVSSPTNSCTPEEAVLRLHHNSLNSGPNDSFSDDDDDLLRHITANRSSDENSELKSRFNRSWIK